MLQNFHSNEVDRHSLSFSVVFSVFPALRNEIWLNQRKLFVWKTFFDSKKWFTGIK